MKLDLHCHVSEGSPDSHVGIEEYIRLLKEQGFQGMLVTDHDSYEGYRYYSNVVMSTRNDDSESDSGYIEGKDTRDDFVVLKGIEYDTFEAGHIIVVLPAGSELPVLEQKGLCLKTLIKLVHDNGGVLGPAHPCGEPFLSIFSTGKYKKDRSIIREFDFIEGFNCGEDPWCNDEAQALGQEYGLPVTGGSDSHQPDCVGLAFTEIEGYIRNEDELIDYIKSKQSMRCGGIAYNGTIKAHLGKWNKLLVYGFWPYNKFGALIHTRRRISALRLGLIRDNK